ncbi:MAG TPA: T9SS type A sorting domain-containing protein, partial [Bacteroidia bacterium]|nr:T9SS type A sorting domain-containing protein [Bacteroidia bacterium]
NVAHLIVPVICTATSVDENSELAKLAIYPNPTRGELTVLIAEQRSKGNVSFRVLNTIGAEVFSSSVPANASGNYKLNLSKLSQGFYFVEIKTSEGRRIEKFQIAR